MDTAHPVLIVSQENTVYEFLVSSLLKSSDPVEKPLVDSYPATSLKFIAYPPCAQSRQSLMHPEPKSPVLLLQSCNKIPQLFKLHPDGVIQHLASGMCIQSSRTDDPMKIAEGESLVLNYPCTLYRSEYNTLHALQFKLTTKGSLMEIRSGKCIYTRDGVENLPLTFTEICDTRNTQIAFVDKRNNVIVPKIPSEMQSKSSVSLSSPSQHIEYPSGGVNKLPTADPIAQVLSIPQQQNFGLVSTLPSIYCPSSCSTPCMPSCEPMCCRVGLQQPGNMLPTYPNIIRCASNCSPEHCPSSCPVGCCFPNLMS
ncbi:uncharacterized protein LOC124457489 isoform X2 [Xenia sp. Carnegie-2017]|uniref:uncharacterized protein LOC124457489 isoform X2 n=1 Tax=Xenia sp. Carnegie-2017 TaxID=2897299 RepID=UPI001F041171|nr:uncharacterized protein LOC124457489 isoform X2 [Xenia sp. Carnegie-2017]